LSISVQEVAPDKIPSAAGIFHFIRAMLGAVGTAIFTTIWQRRTYFHHMRMGESLTPYNPLLPHVSSQPALELLNRQVDVQAAMLAINDAFFLMGWLFIALIALLLVWNFFGKRTDKNKAVIIGTSD
jgi:DHA2 family multidrug resistance protein